MPRKLAGLVRLAPNGLKLVGMGLARQAVRKQASSGADRESAPAQSSDRRVLQVSMAATHEIWETAPQDAKSCGQGLGGKRIAGLT